MNLLNQFQLIKNFKNNEFINLGDQIPETPKCPAILNFMGTDDEAGFKKNQKLMPDDWRYHSKKIEYHINNFGYRAPEFDLVDWKESIVVFGCSNVLGTGLAEDETLSHQLHRLTSRPVINMGVGGSSMFFSFINALILNQGFPKPHSVINIWTSYERLSIFSGNIVRHHGAWEDTPELRAWTQDYPNPLMYALMIQRASSAIWQNKTRYFEGTFFEHTANSLNCTNFPWHDTARDRIHPGPETVENAAKLIQIGLKV